MTTITWDDSGSRLYEFGVDRCVLYPQNAPGVPWNGVTSVSDNNSTSANPIYFDGVKFADEIEVGDYAGSITAYTYPDELLEIEGLVSVSNGLYLTEQTPKRFGLTYRTRIGNDTDGENHGYKIHILYNLLAIPTQKSYQTLSDSTNASEFSWDITGIPAEITGYSPTAHVIFDTRFMSESLIKDVEDTLYGDGVSEPTLPAAPTLVSFIDRWVIIRITDNGNGTWTAEGPDNLIFMLDSTMFQINQANVKVIDGNTYFISDTTY